MKQIFEGPMYHHESSGKNPPPTGNRPSCPDALFTDLFASTYGPALVARMHNITLDALMAFAQAPATRAKLDAFRRLALDRAELLAAEARIAAANSLLQHCTENPGSDRARKAASVVFRTPRSPVPPSAGANPQRPDPDDPPPSPARPKPAPDNKTPPAATRCPRLASPASFPRVSSTSRPATQAPTPRRSPRPRGEGIPVRNARRRSAPMKLPLVLSAAAALAAAAHAQPPRITCQLTRTFLPSGHPFWFNFGDYGQVALSTTISPPIGTQVPIPIAPGTGTVASLDNIAFDLIACGDNTQSWTLSGSGFQGTTGTTWGIRSGWFGFPGTAQPNGDILGCIVGQFTNPNPSPLNPVAEIWRARWVPSSLQAGRKMRLTLYPSSASILVRYGTSSGGQPLYTSIPAVADPVWIDLMIDPGQPPPCWTWISGNPQSAAVSSGSPATLNVQAFVCPQPGVYTWRRNCQPLLDGGRISGAGTDTLRIDPVTFADAGQYDVVVNQATSDAATLSVLCYANCDASTTPPILNVNDFACFLNAFAAGNSYANCDHSTTPPVLNVLDFACFLNQFAAGCP